MKTTNQRSKFQIALDQNQLQIIHQALNEVCNGIEVPEFETRIGATELEVRKLMTLLGKFLDQSALR